MAKRRSALDHLNNGRVPHIVTAIPPGAPGFKEAQGGTMVVSCPAEIDGLIRAVRPGEVVTLDDVRAAAARRHGATIACPVSTAIFVNMAARAAEERRTHGESPATLTPWWRVLRPGGFLNPKLPGGIERQLVLLAAEGVKASPLRRQLAVFDFVERRPADPLELREVMP